MLRSRSVPGLEQEIFALLTVYQALVRMAGDVTTATPALSVQRVSFTVLFQAAADQIIVAPGPARSSTASLIGAIGRAVLANLLPIQCRQRLKARYRKTSACTSSSGTSIRASCRRTHWSSRWSRTETLTPRLTANATVLHDKGRDPDRPGAGFAPATSLPPARGRRSRSSRRTEIQ